MLKKIILVVCGYFLCIGTFSAAFAASASASSEPDYYAVLGVSPKATAEEIKTAWKKQIIMHHTDKVSYNLPSTATEEDRAIAEEQANEKTKLINGAYNVLRDEKTRSVYDNDNRHRLKQESHSRAGARGSSSASASASSAAQSGYSEPRYKPERRPEYKSERRSTTDARGSSSASASSAAQSGYSESKYNSNGSLIGVVKDKFGASSAQGKLVVVQKIGGENKLVVVGNADNELLLTRYNANGMLDRSFGVNGVVRDGFGTEGAQGYSVIIQQDGKLVVVGNAGRDMLLARYSANGILDATFGENKIVKYPNAAGYSVIERQDGKLVVIGKVGNELLLACYNAGGILDVAFGAGGVVRSKFSADFVYAPFVYGYSAIDQQDGKLVVAGYISYLGMSDMFLACYSENGTLDEAFGARGLVRSTFGFVRAGSGSVIVQQIDGDNKLVIVGGTNNDMFLARYNANGTLDTTFGVKKNGVELDNFGARFAVGNSVIMQQDGKLVVVGRTSDDMFLARYNANGTLDTTFGVKKNGVVLDNFGAFNAEGYSVIEQQDGKLVVVGNARNDMFLARYNSDGTLDQTFGVPAQQAQAVKQGQEAGQAQ